MKNKEVTGIVHINKFSLLQHIQKSLYNSKITNKRMKWKLFGVTEQIKQIPKIWLIVKNPAKFFQKNKDNEENILIFATLTTRLSLIIDFVRNLIISLVESAYEPFVLPIILYLTAFIFAPVLAWLGVKIGGFFTNLFVRIFAKKNDYPAAQRVIAYSSVAGLIPNLPFLSIVGVILYFVFEIIGVSKQYKISYPLSVLISITPILILLVLMAFFVLVFILPVFLLGSPVSGEAIK